MTSPPPLATRWPAQMRAETAAAYLDEKTKAAFLRSVREGLYPPPVDVPGKGPRWLLEDLERALARIHHNAKGGGRRLADRV